MIKICIYIDTIPILFIVTTAPPTWDWNCLESEFQCHNGQCITYHCVCDGKSNCYDGTDEDYCNSTGWFCYSPFQQECAYTRSRASAVTFCSPHAFTSSLIYYSTEAQKMKSLEKFEKNEGKNLYYNKKTRTLCTIISLLYKLN